MLKTLLALLALTMLFESSTLLASTQTQEKGVGVVVSSDELQDFVYMWMSSRQFQSAITLKDFETEKPQVQFKNVPQIVSDYGKSLFHLNLDDAFNLNLKVFSPEVHYNMAIVKTTFETMKEAIVVNLKFEISDIDLQSSAVWIRELGLTDAKNKNLDIKNACSKDKVSGEFFKNHVFASVENVHLKAENHNDSKILISARFQIKNEEDKVVLSLLSMNSDLNAKASSLYTLSYQKLNLPRMFIKVGEECFESDLSAVRDYVDTQKDNIKKALLKALSNIVAGKGSEQIRNSLENLNIPTGFSREDAPWLRSIDLDYHMDYSTFEPDHTKVSIQKAIVDEGAREDGDLSKRPEVAEKLVKFFKYLYSVSLEFNLSKIKALDESHLLLLFSNQLAINTYETHDEDTTWDLRSLSTGKGSRLSMLIPRGVIQSKLVLLEMLKIFEKTVFPSGVYLDEDTALTIQPGNKECSCVRVQVSVKVILDEVQGLMPQIGSYYEKIFGSTGGILHLPVVVQVQTKDSNIRLLLDDFYKRSEFLEQSNLGDASGLIRNQVLKQLDQLSVMLKDKVIHVPENVLLEKTGLNMKALSFDGDGNLQIFLEDESASEKILEKVKAIKTNAH